MDTWKTREGIDICWRDLKDSHLENIVRGLSEGASFGVPPQERSQVIFAAERELVKRELVKAIKGSSNLVLLLTSPYKCLRDLAEYPFETVECYLGRDYMNKYKKF